MSDTVFCTCGKEVQVRTDKRIAKHVSGERLKRGLLGVGPVQDVGGEDYDPGDFWAPGVLVLDCYLTRSPSPANMVTMNSKREAEIRRQIGGEAPCPTCGEPRKALLGSKLRTVRKSAGVGMREMARKAELSPSFVSEVERDKKSLGMAAADRLLRGLGI